MKTILIALLCLAVLVAVGIAAFYLFVWLVVGCLVLVFMMLESICSAVASPRQVEVTIRREAIAPGEMGRKAASQLGQTPQEQRGAWYDPNTRGRHRSVE